MVTQEASPHPVSWRGGGGGLSLGLPVEVGTEPCALGAGGGERRRQGGVSVQTLSRGDRPRQPCPPASSGLLLTERGAPAVLKEASESESAGGARETSHG